MVGEPEVVVGREVGERLPALEDDRALRGVEHAAHAQQRVAPEFLHSALEGGEPGLRHVHLSRP